MPKANPMPCPQCGHHTSIYFSIRNRDGRHRKRQCTSAKCGYKFITLQPGSGEEVFVSATGANGRPKHNGHNEHQPTTRANGRSSSRPKKQLRFADFHPEYQQDIRDLLRDLRLLISDARQESRKGASS